MWTKTDRSGSWQDRKFRIDISEMILQFLMLVFAHIDQLIAEESSQ